MGGVSGLVIVIVGVGVDRVGGGRKEEEAELSPLSRVTGDTSVTRA